MGRIGVGGSEERGGGGGVREGYACEMSIPLMLFESGAAPRDIR